MNIISERVCPYCSSTETRKSGHLVDGTQKYQCSSCGKYFSNKTVVREKLDKTCPVCLSKNIKRSGTCNGKQRYLCKDCGKKFSDFTPRVFPSHDVECPHCGNLEAKLGGHDSTGKQYYICKVCRHKFLKDGKFKQLTKEQREEIVELWKEGHQMPELTSAFAKSERTIRNLLKPYRKAFEETHLRRASARITSAEKKIILMYGIGAKVSATDLARHLVMEVPLIEYVIENYIQKVTGGMHDK